MTTLHASDDAMIHAIRLHMRRRRQFRMARYALMCGLSFAMAAMAIWLWAR